VSKNEVEIWKNATQGVVVLAKVDPMTGRQTWESVNGGREFGITIDERRYNQGRVYDASVDVFTNGTLKPVKLIDTAEDAKELASNPNHMSEDDMRKLATGPRKALDAQLEKISSISTLNTLKDLALEQDAPNSVLASISERIDGLTPARISAEVTSTDKSVTGDRAPNPRSAR
jgi:hypothetical protein